VLWLDDVQWGSDALGLATWLLTQRSARESTAGELPVLVVMTAREEALAARALESSQVADLAVVERVESIVVPPLDARERAGLVRHLLGLEATLAARVEARTGGNPLFAIHLVGDWVQRGILEPRALGFVLAEGANADLPRDLHHMWSGHLDRLLANRGSEGGATGLELAAALGQEIDDAEWHAALAEAGVDVPEGLLQDLVTGALARRVENGWAFAHGMVREVFEIRSRDAGRWQAQHAACARMLQRRVSERGVSERLGYHLLAAGDLTSALAPLLSGARQRGDQSEYRIAHSVLDERERAMRQTVPPSDAQWGEGWVVREFVLRQQGRLAEAEEWGTKAVQAADQYEWPLVRAMAREAVGAGKRQTGRFAARQGHLEAALAEYRSLDQNLGVARCLAALGLFEAYDDPRGIAMATDGLGLNARVDGRLDDAVALHRRALARFESMGDLVGRAEVWRGLGEVERVRGDLDQAEACFRRGLDLLSTAESEWHGLYQAYLGVVLMLRNQFLPAQRILNDVFTLMETWNQPHYLAAIRMCQAVCAAGLRDWEAWPALFGQAAAFLDDTQYVDDAVAEFAELAGDLARTAGHLDEAREAQALADDMWRRMGKEERASQAGTA
jgi:tetratricopeptide (TPR) repeat protein